MGKGKGIGLGGTGEQGRYNQNTSHKILWEQILKLKGEKKSNMNQREFSAGPGPGNQVNTVELLCVAPGIPALKKARQEDCWDLKAILSHVVQRLKKTKNNKKQKNDNNNNKKES